MSDRVFFSVKKQIMSFINNERISIEDVFLDHLLRFLSKVCNYEEEEIKIRPRLILSKGIHKVIKEIPSHYILPIGVGKNDGSNFNKMMKSIVPFCNLGWFVYIDMQQDGVEYGVIRSFSGPKGLTLTETLFFNADLETVSDDVAITEFSVVNKFEINLSGLRKQQLVIDFRLIDEKPLDIERSLENMAWDIVRGIDDEQAQENLQAVYKKLLKVVLQKVHGTICMVVKKKYEFPNNFIFDGVWFKTPMDISEIAQYALHEGRDVYVSEKYYALSGLFIEMMNVDGITVIDDTGKVRGFNVFVNKQEGMNIKPLLSGGGARKRAFNTLMATKDSNILGVYFQSQDGEVQYERMSDYNE